MFKHLLLFVSIIILSVTLGVWFKADPGYVLVVFHHWQIQTSLVVLLLMLGISLILLKYGFKLLKATLNLPQTLAGLVKGLNQKRQNKRIHEGLEAFFQGQWYDAVKKIRPLQEKSAWNIDLLAAEAAQQQGALGLRDQFIHSALKQSPQSKESILLYQAKLQLAEGQFEQAQATLKSIDKPSKLWLKLQLELDAHFEHYEKGLKDLENTHKAFVSQTEYHQQYKTLLLALLKQKIEASDLDSAMSHFLASPKAIQLDADVIACLAPHSQLYPKVQKKLIKSIKNMMQAPLPESILMVLPSLPYQSHWLDLLNRLSKQDAENDKLLLIMGMMKAKQKLWGSAIADIQASIAIKPTGKAYSTLAHIYLDLDQSSNALAAMQQALELND